MEVGPDEAARCGCPPPHDLLPALLRTLRILDRVQLQIAWTQDGLRRAEHDMLQALGMPFSDPAKGSWEPTALLIHIEGIQQLLGELVGLHAALASL